MSADGCFIDAPLILIKEEYSAKVLFDRRLIHSIERSAESRDIFYKLDLPYVELNEAAIAFDFGDLLTHVPIFERLKWAEFYRGIIILTGETNNNNNPNNCNESNKSSSSIQTDMANKLL